MIMIISCSSTTPTCKFPSCDVVMLSSNDIRNWYSFLWMGLHIKVMMLLKGLSLFEIHSNTSLSHFCTSDQYWFGICLMTTDNFCFYLQNILIQTSQTGGQRYSDTSPLSIPCLDYFAAPSETKKKVL